MQDERFQKEVATIMAGMSASMDMHPNEAAYHFPIDASTSMASQAAAAALLSCERGQTIILTSEETTPMTQPKPTFQEVRKRHSITLNMLIEDAQIDPSAVLLLDTWSIGEAGIIDTLLASLSRLCGTAYRRDLLNIGGFTFSVNPPYERVAAAAMTEESQRRSQRGRSEQDEDAW